MRKLFWTTLLFAGLLVGSALVTAQETTPRPTHRQMQGMGQMMGMMGGEGQSAQMGQMGSMMPMMQGMTRMMEACSQMMGTAPSTEQGSGK